MKEENIKNLRKELVYLLDEEVNKELVNYDNRLDGKVNIQDIAKEIYLKRGINYQKIKKGFFEKLMDTMENFSNSFKNKESATKKKMVIDIVLSTLLLIFLKVPFDFVRDVSYDYIKVLSTNNTYYVLWQLLFLLIYTIVLVCALIVYMRGFSKKYQNMK